MTTPDYPRPVDCLKRLQAAGWAMDDDRVNGPAGGLAWVVTGHNGEDRVRAEAPTMAEAWQAACGQAEAMGMLRR